MSMGKCCVSTCVFVFSVLRKNSFSVLPLNVILLLFVVQCGKNIVEKMSLINTTAE